MKNESIKKMLMEQFSSKQMPSPSVSVKFESHSVEQGYEFFCSVEHRLRGEVENEQIRLVVKVSYEEESE